MEGILEEMFTAIEFIKGKADSRLTVAQVLEEKHGYGAAIKKEDFDPNVRECLPKLIEFSSYEVYSNTSKFVKVRLPLQRLPPLLFPQLLRLLPPLPLALLSLTITTTMTMQLTSIILRINSRNTIPTSKGPFYGIWWISYEVSNSIQPDLFLGLFVSLCTVWLYFLLWDGKENKYFRPLLVMLFIYISTSFQQKCF